MMWNTPWLVRLLLCVSSVALVQPVPVYAVHRVPFFVSGPDADFLALREASLRGDTGDAGRLSARLTDYPIPSYVPEPLRWHSDS